MNNFSNKEIALLEFLQKDIPICSRPYKLLAEELDISEVEVLEIIESFKKRRVIKRIGAILYHRNVGYTSNAMVAWNIETNNIDIVGDLFSKYTQVSHCYYRNSFPSFNYSIFTMIHAMSENQLNELINQLEILSDCHDYKVLKSVKEWKKVSMQYSFK
ncbi:MAG: Lrp/AsnC family transcriptional regulator [Caldisericia bacterium]|nr:Lrp/AsnC family transcriptional regulator [Caldisericia bacterium]